MASETPTPRAVQSPVHNGEDDLISVSESLSLPELSYHDEDEETDVESNHAAASAACPAKQHVDFTPVGFSHIVGDRCHHKENEHASPPR